MNIFNFLHTVIVNPIAFSIGTWSVRWYGIIIALAIAAGVALAVKIGPYYKVKKELIFDLVSYLIIGGLIGARLYDVLLELPYYLSDPHFRNNFC
jgi:phosphatidylglycerol:prolipoprotein diacylglycerol transferase